MLCHLLTKTLKRPPKIQDQDFVKSCSNLLYRTYTLVIFTETHKSNLNIISKPYTYQNLKRNSWIL
jgi:hypothetical protein